ncbi:Site-specific recombinase [Methylobacterium radiotolerans]|nr:Site-specific recombinase [Methylobacterium radiotolerans]
MRAGFGVLSNPLKAEINCQKYMKLARLEGLSAHDLRHRYGYVMAENTPLHRLAQIMGHDSLDTTMIYVKATQAIPG